MKDEERDNGLESLFREKLEENEMVAGSDLTDRFMHRLERREFFRFNLSRFNIWYVTAVAAAIIVAGVLLINDSRDEAEPVMPQEDLPRVAVTSDNTISEVAPSQAVVIKTDSDTGDSDATDGGEAVTEPGEVAVRQSPITTSDGAPGKTAAVSSGEASGLAKTAPQFTAAIEPSVISGCVPLHVKFSSNAADRQKALWNLGDGGTSTETCPDYIYDIPGTYRVILNLTDEKGRVSTATTLIEAWDNPRAAFEVRQNDNGGENDRVVFVNLSTGAVDYLWDFGDGTFSTLAGPTYRYERMGRYDVKLTAYTANGCADSVTVNDLFTDEGTYIRFPNAFMPNKGGPTGGYYNQRTDEENQVFHPVASGVDSYNLKIYSKSGLLVFESDDIAMGWDGYNKGRLCSPGVYVWKVRGTYRNGQSIIMAGDVTLVNY